MSWRICHHTFLPLPVGETILQLSGHGSLEEQVQAAMPDWQQAFCNTAGCAPGHPKCLLISPAALGAIAMIKSFPTFNQVIIQHSVHTAVQIVSSVIHSPMKQQKTIYDVVLHEINAHE